MDERRSADARELAEEALMRLVVQVPAPVPLVVLGGLVAPLLTENARPLVPAHLGTNDADVLVDLAIEADYAVIERALLAAHFTTDPDPAYTGWRWWVRIGDVPVRVEFSL